MPERGLEPPLPPAIASSRAYSSSLTFVPMDFLRNTGFTMPTLLLLHRSAA
ncbi:MAG TPA: hypothetical protein VNF02_00250 [Candidatus Limnocylindrales bacterium]|nr:hypothetical protein [Candidatus Limnocylindrales bacterium]